MGPYSFLLGGLIVVVVLAVVLRSVRTRVAAQRAAAAQQDLRERIRQLPPPPIKPVREPELKLPRRQPGDGSTKPWPPK